MSSFIEDLLAEQPRLNMISHHKKYHETPFDIFSANLNARINYHSTVSTNQTNTDTNNTNNNYNNQMNSSTNSQKLSNTIKAQHMVANNVDDLGELTFQPMYNSISLTQSK